VHFDALEQTLRLGLVLGPTDEQFFLIMGSALTHTVGCKVALEQDLSIGTIFRRKNY
jgi:hypothetical protein